MFIPDWLGPGWWIGGHPQQVNIYSTLKYIGVLGGMAPPVTSKNHSGTDSQKATSKARRGCGHSGRTSGEDLASSIAIPSACKGTSHPWSMQKLKDLRELLSWSWAPSGGDPKHSSSDTGDLLSWAESSAESTPFLIDLGKLCCDDRLCLGPQRNFWSRQWWCGCQESLGRLVEICRAKCQLQLLELHVYQQRDC